MKDLENMARELRNKYQREWRKQNPEKVKIIIQRHWLRKAQAELEQQKKRHGGIADGKL